MNNAIDYFFRHVPYRTRCANHSILDTKRVRSLERAVTYALIDPNTARTIRWLAFDVDRDDAAFDWVGCHVPPPTLVCQNPLNGYAQLLYALQTPVSRANCARLSLLERLEMVEHSLSNALGANIANSGGLLKNPKHEYCQPIECGNIYTLDELANKLPMVSRRYRSSTDPVVGLRRNCETIEKIQEYAYWDCRYNPIRDYGNTQCVQKVYDQLCAELEYYGSDIQRDFQKPLTWQEVQLIAQSVAKSIWIV